MEVTADIALRLVRILSENIERAYPYHLHHVVRGDSDVRSPQQMTPVFYGSYDWHSSVHSHWALAELAVRFPWSPWRDEVVATLECRLTGETVAAEIAYLRDHPGFETPYGMVWLVALGRALTAELSPSLHRDVAPLSGLAVDRLSAWIGRLTRAERSGQHGNSAFAMSMTWDLCPGLRHPIRERAHTLHLDDRDGAPHLEPSANDFLSPTLAVADLMSRVLGDDFAGWLDGFLPSLGRDSVPEPAQVVDRRDGKLVHIDGLNLSRSWMLRAIASALPGDDSRVQALAASADKHLEVGAEFLSELHYAGSHWLPTFLLCATRA